MGGRGTAALAVSIMTVLALGACGSDGGTDPSGTETSSTATTDSPTDAPTESRPLLRPNRCSCPRPRPSSRHRDRGSTSATIRVNIPKGWKQTFDSFVVDSALGRVDGKTGGVLLSVVPTGGDVLTPKQAERYFWTRGRKPQNYQKQDDILMGGLTAGYYTARDRFDDIHAATLWEDEPRHEGRGELRPPRCRTRCSRSCSSRSSPATPATRMRL